MDLISSRKVLPSGPENADILFVGEAPGYEEDKEGIPFCGDSGNIFNYLLGSIGLSRETVRVTNICNYRPNNNKFDYLINSSQLREGIDEVQEYIRVRRPRWVVVVGAKPLEYLLHRKGKRNGIENWRGSVIEQDSQQYFCSLHPATIGYSNGSLYPIISHDFQRFQRYYREGYELPKHNFTIDPQGESLIEAIAEIKSHKVITVDLEGVKGTFHIRCAGFGLSKSRAISIFNHQYNGLEISFVQSINSILADPSIEKVFQNGFGYDIEMLNYHGIEVENYSFDTMIAAHVLEPEFPYGLGFLTSIYTDEPYYKSMVRSDDEDDGKGVDFEVTTEILGDYNCRDCITDYEIAEKQKIELTQQEKWETYDYKHSLIPLGQAISRPGLFVDTERKALLECLVDEKIKYYSQLLNTLAGFNVNVKSPIHMKKLLIDTWGLPQRKDPKTKSPTYNEDAIVSYISLCQQKINEYRTEDKIFEWECRLGGCKCILLVRGFRQLQSNYFDAGVSADGRIRSIYNFSAATETGRGSSHMWIDGTGLNSQTFSRERFEISNEDYARILTRAQEGYKPVRIALAEEKEAKKRKRKGAM